MVIVLATAAPATVRIAIAQVGRRLVTRSIPRVTERSSRDVATSLPFVLAAGDTSVLSQQTRPITSSLRLGRTSLGRGPPLRSLVSVPPAHGALRRQATVPSEVPPGAPYASPYAGFFANVAAGRSSLGTTAETERRAHELREKRLECGIPESALRFRTTSYGRYVLPPYVAPGEHRVTVKVALAAIPFANEQERDVFLQIVGPRFRKGDLQLSSEKFASRIENKRYLVEQIEQIVSGARTVAEEYADGETPRTAK